MLVTDSFVDLPTSSTPLRLFLYHPIIPSTPNAKFPCVLVFPEIYQVTAPVSRICRSIASHGYLVASPCLFHEFEGFRAMNYDTRDTDLGNAYKIRKSLASYDEDVALSIDYLHTIDPRSNRGTIGTVGICLGGHLSFRASFHAQVSASVVFFGTDLHSSTLSQTGDDSLKRASQGAINAELLLIFGKLDNHVPRSGRDLIRTTLDDAEVSFTWLELAWAQHAFVRDEMSKGRFDASITGVCMEMMFELFSRTIAVAQ